MMAPKRRLQYVAVIVGDQLLTTTVTESDEDPAAAGYRAVGKFVCSCGVKDYD